ncbi:MAG TPA: CPBP family glutamic-type intramembrane protease [Anaerolineae bacterium]
MSLKTVFVREDWQVRSRQRQRADKTQWSLILLTVAICALFALYVFQIPFREELLPRSARGLISTVFLVEGIYILYRPSHSWQFLFGSGAFLLFGILISTAATDLMLASRSLDRMVFVLLLALVGIGLLVPVWSILLWLRYRRRDEFLAAFPGSEPWARRFVYGLVGGATIAGVLFLSQSFTGLTVFHDLPPAPVLVYILSYSLGIGPLGEEIFFRGIVFQHIFKSRSKKLWTAIVLTLALNLIVYAAEYYFTPTWGYLALLLLGLQAPAIMIIANSTLFAWKSNLVSPVVSNMIFRLFWLAMGAR